MMDVDRDIYTLEYFINGIELPDKEIVKNAQKRWDRVAKPLHSLGLLEDAIIKIAGITRNIDAPVDKKAVIMMCADNGVVEEGVTQTDSSVTAIVTRQFTKGESCVCLMAKRAGAMCIPVDIGVAQELDDIGDVYPLRTMKISKGTKNFRKVPAMTMEEVTRAILIGIDLVRECKEDGYHMLAVGEMGIGNTTTSSAVASVLLQVTPEEVTGKGAGLSKEGLEKKIQVIKEAIVLHNVNAEKPLEVLQMVGGLDLAGMVGLFLGGAYYKIPMLMDGMISATAALVATRICPHVKEYILASHVSKEPAGQLLLDMLGLKPLLACEMCLGEGTGAVASMPLFDMAHDIYKSMNTFEDIKIEEYKPL